MYKDFSRRLHRDIKRMVDTRLALSASTSVVAKAIDVNVVSHKKQRYAVWFGGSLLADTVIYGVDESLSFIAIAIRKHNMRNTDPRLRDTTRSLGAFFSVSPAIYVILKLWKLHLSSNFIYRKYKSQPLLLLGTFTRELPHSSIEVLVMISPFFRSLDICR